MNKKILRTGILSLAAFLTIAAASPAAASAHGYGGGHRQMMRNGESAGHHMQNHPAWGDENEQGEWREWHESMHNYRFDESSSDQEEAYSENRGPQRMFARGGCFGEGMHRGNGNGWMMRSRGWDESWMDNNHHLFGQGRIENN